MEDARQVVARPNGQDGHRGSGAGGVLANVVQAGERPSNRPVTAAHEDLEAGEVAKTVQAGERTTVLQVEDLSSEIKIL